MKPSWQTLFLFAAVSAIANPANALEGAIDKPVVAKPRYGLKAAQERNDRQAKREQRRKAAAAIKRVDINNASREELKTLPGIGDREAESIIAGRPYRSKAWLVTHHVLNGGIYEAIKTRIIAGRPMAPPAEKR